MKGGEAPPVPLWMQHRIAERLSIAFLNVQRTSAVYFTVSPFHSMAVAIGAKSKHWQRYGNKAKYPGGKLLQEAIEWVDLTFLQRREIGTKYPSTRLDIEGPFSHVIHAKSVLEDAQQRLFDESTIHEGLLELEGLQQRWPTSPSAIIARSIQLQYQAKQHRPWEDRRQNARSGEAIQSQMALTLLNKIFKGIKSDVRMLNRSRGRKNYIDEYVVMKWNKSSPKPEINRGASARFEKKTLSIARRMGEMITLDHCGKAKILNLAGTRVTTKQLRTVKEQLHGLENLRALDLSSTLLQETALKQIADLIGLQALNLNHVEVTNRGVSHLAKLNQLQYLSLAFTEVSSLQQLHSLVELRWLILGGTRTKDAALKQLAMANNLQQLSIFSCPITDKGMSHLVPLSKLRFLNIAATKVSDAGCRSLAQVQSLEVLVLDDSEVTDLGLTVLAKLSKLRHLSLEGLQISDKGLVTLKEMSHLESINLTKTQVTQDGIADFQSALPNCRVQWNGDPINYRSQLGVQLAKDTLLRNIMAVRRYGLRELQRKQLGVCVRSGEGLRMD